MESGTKVMGNVFKKLLSAFEKTGKQCPVCGDDLVRPRDAIDRDTHEKIVTGMCPGCFYSERLQGTIDLQQGPASASQLQLSARKADKTRWMVNSSLYSNPETQRYRLSNFEDDTVEHGKAIISAQQVINALVDGQVAHATYFGSPGTGKTHIAHAIMRAVLARSGYFATVMFLDWREYIDFSKNAISGSREDKQYIADIQAHYKSADLVVLDDYGSERSSPWAIDLSDQFWRNREDKSVIMTTNLNVEEIKQRYGARTMSRIAKHAQGFGLKMTGEDARKVAGV